MEHSNSIIAIVLLLTINAFFVAAEFALVKVKRFRIDAAAEADNSSAKLAQKILDNLESYLAACQLGITMASLGLGWVGEPVVAALLKPIFIAMGMPDAVLHTVSFLLGFLIFSALHIVVGEQVPKTFAIRKAETVSLFSVYPLHFFFLLAYPLNWLLNKASASILALFNVEEATHADVMSDAEIRGAIVSSEKHGDLTSDKANMLSNMFDFDNHVVEQIMVPRNKVEVLDLNNSFETNLDIVQASKHSRFPVLDGDQDTPIGIVLAKDFYGDLVSETPHKDPIRKNIRSPLLVPESQRVTKLFESMRQQRTHMAIVMDEYGGFSGVVTLEDLLEEIVGEIADELDIEEPEEFIYREEDHWKSRGMVALADVDRVLGAGIGVSSSANTINGLIMEHLNRMPAQGDEIFVNGFGFTVLSLDRNQVDSVKIYQLAPDSESAIETDMEDVKPDGSDT